MLTGFSSLSERERQLIEFAAHGHTDQAIANLLGISLPTINTYWSRIRLKVGPHSRAELVGNYVGDRVAEQIEMLRQENLRLNAQIETLAIQTSSGHSHLEVLSAAVDGAPDAILVVDETGTILLANDGAVSMFGYERGELEGSPVNQLVPAGHRRQHEMDRATYLMNPERRRMGAHQATSALRKNGEEFLIAATLNHVSSQGRSLVTCVIRDLGVIGWAYREREKNAAAD